MDLIAELPTISGRSLTDLGCRVKRVANECRAIALVHVGCVKSSEHTGIPWGMWCVPKPPARLCLRPKSSFHSLRGHSGGWDGGQIGL